MMWYAKYSQIWTKARGYCQCATCILNNQSNSPIAICVVKVADSVLMFYSLENSTLFKLDNTLMCSIYSKSIARFCDVLVSS